MHFFDYSTWGFLEEEGLYFDVITAQEIWRQFLIISIPFLLIHLCILGILHKKVKNFQFCRIYCWCLFICYFQIRSKSGIMPNLPRDVDSLNFDENITFYQTENSTLSQALLVIVTWKKFFKWELKILMNNE